MENCTLQSLVRWLEALDTSGRRSDGFGSEMERFRVRNINSLSSVISLTSCEASEASEPLPCDFETSTSVPPLRKAGLVGASSSSHGDQSQTSANHQRALSVGEKWINKWINNFRERPDAAKLQHSEHFGMWAVRKGSLKLS